MKIGPQWSRSVRYLVCILLLLFLLVGLWYIRSALEPLIVAAFIAYLLNPGVEYLSNHSKLSRKASVNLVYFVVLVLGIGTPSTLTPIFFDELKQVFRDLVNLYDQVIFWMINAASIPSLRFDFSDWAIRLNEFRANILTSLPDQALQLLESTSLGMLWVLVIMVAVYYLLSAWPQIRTNVFHLFPEPYQPDVKELYRHIRSAWMSYLRSQILLMFIVGTAFTIAWSVIGIPGALVLGVIAGLLTLIPDVGPFIAFLLALGVALLEGSSWIHLSNLWIALIVLVVYAVLIAIKNFWLRPYILGRSVHISEALVFILIIISTVMWGILGALLVIPTVASLVILLDYLRLRIFGEPPFSLSVETNLGLVPDIKSRPERSNSHLRPGKKGKN